MMIATQLNEGTFNIYIWEILEQRSSSTQRYYLILSWEGANARYTLFPFSMVFLTKFSSKGFNKVFNEAASRAHYEINVIVPSLGFFPKGFFQEGYNKTLFHFTDIQGGVL